MSPILFCLFIADLPDCIPSSGLNVNVLMYADDLVLLGESPEALQESINSLSRWSAENSLKVNVGKTKCMIFHLGRRSKCSFSYDGHALDIVKNFCYLGIHFSAQLSFSFHTTQLIQKAKSRIGLLFQKLKLTQLPLHVVLSVFNCYITPIFRYGSHLWTSRVAKSVVQSINSLFTKFLKRYLCIPSFIQNNIVHHLTSTTPFFTQLLQFCHNNSFPVSFPSHFSSVKLQFLSIIPEFVPYLSFMNIPSTYCCLLYTSDAADE